MVRRIILATAVSLCLSSHCAADAVRKASFVDPITEAKKQEAEKTINELNLLLRELHRKTAKGRPQKAQKQRRDNDPEAKRTLDLLNEALLQQGRMQNKQLPK